MEWSFTVMVRFGVIFLCFIGLVKSSCDSICSPGEFLSSSCKCLPCPNNTFTDKKNNESKCRPCKMRCEPSMVVEKTCTKTHDTVCSCKPGKYLDPGILFCMDCAVCSAGYGAAQPCSTGSNTVCLPCILGKTYSNITSFSKPCTACTVCPAGYSIKYNCTNITDTVCQIKPYVNTTHKTNKTRTPKVPVSSTSISTGSKGSKNKDFLVPLLSIAVLLLLGLLICLAVRLYKRLKARRQPAGAAQDSKDGEEVVPIKSKPVATTTTTTTSRQGGLRGRHKRHHRRNDISRESDSQGSSTGSLQEEKLRDPERLLRNLHNESLIIDDLGQLLNPTSRNNWHRLAGELGYPKQRVDCFGIDPHFATQNLLSDWRTTNSSTIGMLYGCLKKMKRDDACEILEGV